MTHKGDNHRPYNFKAKDQGLTIYHENCRRKREEGLEPMTPVEAEAFLTPRINHAETLAFGDDPEAPLLQPVALKD